MSCMVFHILVVLWFAKMIHFFFFWINENGVKMILLCKTLGSSVLCMVQVRYEFHIVQPGENQSFVRFFVYFHFQLEKSNNVQGTFSHRGNQFYFLLNFIWYKLQSTNEKVQLNSLPRYDDHQFVLFCAFSCTACTSNCYNVYVIQGKEPSSENVTLN